MFLATKLQFKYRKTNYIQYSSFLKISITQKQNSNLFILGTKIIHKEWKEMNISLVLWLVNCQKHPNNELIHRPSGF